MSKIQERLSFRVLFLSLSFCLLFSCGEKESSKQSPQGGKNVSETKAIVHENEVLIYWDISVPVQGYFTSETGIKKILHNNKLLFLLRRNDFIKTNLMTVGKEISPLKEINDMSDFMSPTTYNDSETRLDLIFGDKSEIHNFPLIIVATDGLQYSSSGIRGADPTPVVSGIKKIIDKDWNFWMIGVKAPFRGQRYSEHRQDWYPYTINNQCPFYFWIFSKDRERGQKIVDDISALLRKEVTKGIEVLKLFPLNNAPFTFTLKFPKPEAENIISPSSVKMNNSVRYMEQELWCVMDGRGKYPINGLINLKDLGLWQLTYFLDTKERLFLLDGFTLSIDCELVKKSNFFGHFSKDYEKDYQAKIGVKRIDPISESEKSESGIWWREWNTEDDWAKPTKTYKLAQFMEDIIKYSLMKNPPELTIKVLKQ